MYSILIKNKVNKVNNLLKRFLLTFVVISQFRIKNDQACNIVGMSFLHTRKLNDAGYFNINVGLDSAKLSLLNLQRHPAGRENETVLLFI